MQILRWGRRQVLLGAGALVLAAAGRAGGTPDPLAGLPAAQAAWWPPIAGQGPAGSWTGWAMSKEGPMAMPRVVHDMLYGPAGSLAKLDQLRDVLKRIWEHLASRVDELGDLERRADLLDKEVATLGEKPLESGSVLMGMIENVNSVENRADTRSDELGVKFDQLMAYKGRLLASYKDASREIDTYFQQLAKSRSTADNRYRQVGTRMQRMRGNLGVIQRKLAERIRELARSEPAAGSTETGRAKPRATPRAETPPAPEPVARPWAERADEGTMADAPTAGADDAGQDTLYAPTATKLATAPPKGGRDRRGGRAAETAAEPVAEPAGPEGDVGLYTESGRRRTAKELIEARSRARGAGSPSRQVQPEPPARDSLENAPEPGADQGGNEKPLTAPDADRLLDEFLNDPKVLDKTSKKSGGWTPVGGPAAPPPVHTGPTAGRDRLELAAAPGPGPGPTEGLPAVRRPARAATGPDADLSPFERGLQRDLQESARTDGIDDSKGFGNRDPRLPPPGEPARPWSVKDIVSQLESLEK